jgi:uncharacterized protein YeaO (DUF488 family)
MAFTIRRIYEDDAAAGYRVLVDRLWPRGIRRDRAGIDEWLKDVAPSSELRRWYGHDPDKFQEFARRYGAELARPPAAEKVAYLRDVGRGRDVTLVTATRDVAHSGASVLRDHLSVHTG